MADESIDIISEVVEDESTTEAPSMEFEEIDFSYSVYVKTNSDGVITEVNSSAFISDTTGWTYIDKGDGDKYHHAQGNYFDMPIMDDQGIYNYKLVDGKPVLRTEEDKSPETAKINACAEIYSLKKKLADTDYIAAKIAEGAATKEEYAEKLAERESWRARINELQEQYGLQ